MRATDGAIEACTIDKKTMDPSYSVIGKREKSPLVYAVPVLLTLLQSYFVQALLIPRDPSGRENVSVMMNTVWAAMLLAFEEEAGSVKDVEINEVDIDNFIRAKGAIFSAIRTMLASIDFEVDD